MADQEQEWKGDERRTPRRDWWPTIASVLINALVLAYGYGTIAARVTNLESLRIEQRAEQAAQIGEVKGQITALANDVRWLVMRGGLAVGGK